MDQFALLDQIPIGALVVQENWHVIFWNSCLEEWTGIAREKICGVDLRQVFPELQKSFLPERIKSIFVGGPPIVFSSQFHKHIVPIKTRDGKYRVQHTIVTAVPDFETNQFYALFAIQDVTELAHRLDEYKTIRDLAVQEAQRRERLEEAEHYQRLLAEALRDTAAALNSALRLDDVLDRILENVGRVISYKMVDLMLVENEHARVVRSHQKIQSTYSAVGYTLTIAKTPNLCHMVETGEPMIIPDTLKYVGWVDIPETRWIKSYAGAPILVRGELAGFLGLSSDEPNYFSVGIIEPLKTFANQAAIALQNARLYATVEESAITDELTRLHNRRGLGELGEREVARAQRFGHPLTAILLDIDYFKQVNDQFGHSAGDRVLRALADCLRQHIRNVDIAARIGGEEFVILLPEVDLATGTQIARRLGEIIAQMHVPIERPKPITITVSMGVATITPDISNLAQLIQRADQAQYQAKQNGRNQVAAFTHS